MTNPFGKSFWRGFASMVLYGAFHSLLSAAPTKKAVERHVGTRAYGTFYRLAYNAFALPTFLWMLYAALKQPGPTIYEARGSVKWFLRTIGTLALLWALWGAWQTGFGRLSGFGPAWRGVAGGHAADPREAQSPGFADGAPRRGPSSVQRHPLNFAIPFIFWCYSRGTQRFIGLNTAITLYSILASYPSDARMKARYGAIYQRYAERVPLLWPKFKWEK